MTRWVAIGIVIAIAVFLLFWHVKEGFQNVTDQATSLVFSGSLQDLTAPAALSRLGSLSNSPVASISDYKGTSVWTAPNAQSANAVSAQYRVNFGGTISVSKFTSPGLTGITFVGQDFTSPFIIMDVKTSMVLDPYYRGNEANGYRGVLTSVGTGSPSATYKVTKVSDASGVIFFDATETTLAKPYKITFSGEVDLKRISDLLAVPSAATRSTLRETDVSGLVLVGTSFGDTLTAFDGLKGTSVIFRGPLSAAVADQSIAAMSTFASGVKPTAIQDQAGNTLWTPTTGTRRFKVEFASPVNLRIAQTTIPQKMSGALYVGLLFTDTPPAGGTNRSGALTQLGAADYSMNTVTPTAPESQFPANFLASQPELEKPVTTPVAPTYVDPRSQTVATATDYSRPTVAGPSPTTNRIRIRGRWSNISRPGMITTFGLAAGKKSDGSAVNVVEILDVLSRKIWPVGSDGSVPYTDTGLPELFTIGYDTMFDPATNLVAYMRDYMPSVTYVNPAMPRA